jgi:lysozyme family protein
MPFDDVYYNYTKGFEGGYANDPLDSGGETFRGISRVSNPKWPGWKMIDAAKRKVGSTAKAIDKYFADDSEIDKLVVQIFKLNYWHPLDGTPELPDLVKQKVFDTFVNMGLPNAIKILQRALNALGEQLKIDGKLGPLSRKAALGYQEDMILKQYSRYQTIYYESLIAKKPKYAKFRAAWMRRAAWIPKLNTKS